MRSLNALIRLLLIVLLILTPLILLRKIAPRPTHFPSIPITLLSESESKIYHTDLESYLIGVVAAEMPANFEIEALKAQAIAARTLAVQRLKRFGGRGCQHYPGVDFCDDPSENQAWQSITELKAKWGVSDFPRLYAKISRAVKETSGIIMTYRNKPIDALFHSTCGVGTADASEIWRHQVPYLQSVPCGFDSGSPRFASQINYSWSQFVKCLQLSGNHLKTIRIRKRSEQGRVLWISVGKNLYSGENFRKALALNSTCFTCAPSGNGIVFKTIGYGHGVGMCQYGANGMAKHNFTYSQILRHYYRGIQFGRIN